MQMLEPPTHHSCSTHFFSFSVIFIFLFCLTLLLLLHQSTVTHVHRDILQQLMQLRIFFFCARSIYINVQNKLKFSCRGLQLNLVDTLHSYRYRHARKPTNTHLYTRTPFCATLDHIDSYIYTKQPYARIHMHLTFSKLFYLHPYIF